MNLPHLLMRHAAAVMPDPRRDWMAAMQAEVSEINDPSAALAFAAGCVLTAYHQRISPMRIALTLGRFGVTVVTLLTAGVHIAFLLYWAAIIEDLKTHGMNGWAGRFPMFRGHSAEEALQGIGILPVWHVVALVAMTLAFALSAWFLAHGRLRLLALTAGTGLLINTANALAMTAVNGPYLVHPQMAWLYALAFGLLILAAGAFGGADRWLARRPQLAA
jgi:hypothetical protein